MAGIQKRTIRVDGLFKALKAAFIIVSCVFAFEAFAKKSSTRYMMTVEEMEELVRLVGDQAQNLNSAQAAVNSQKTPVEMDKATCTTCAQTVQEVKYNDRCDSSNSHIENRIQKLKDKSPLFNMLAKPQPASAKFIQPNCVQSFMSKFPKTSLYRSCEPGVGITKKRAARPCISESYVNLVTNSFNLAATCLPHLNSLTVFTAAKLFPHESGFHINAMRPGGYDSGVGQLISISIRDVNQVGLDDIRKDLRSSKSPACQAVYSELMNKQPPLTDSNSRACERINVENGNPLVNLIYALELLQIKQQRLDKMTWNRYKSKLSHLSEADQYKIREAVLMYAYNIGESVSTAVNSVLSHRYAGRTVKSADEFIQHLKREVKYYVTNRAGASAGSQKSNYLNQVTSKFDEVNRNLGGGKCLAQGK